MTSTLNSLKPNQGSRKKKLRKGRGIAAGQGASCGFGMRGQKSRSGRPTRPGFEGGQMPLQQRVPKFGFSSRVNNSLKQLNLRDLKDLSEVSLETLKENKLISKSVNKVKVFGKHDLDKAINFSGVSLTKGALESVEKAGGKVS